jgi:hypothetical protein
MNVVLLRNPREPSLGEASRSFEHMRLTSRLLPPLGILAALAAIAPATAGASRTPIAAHAAGGDVVVLTYPSLVKTRVARARRALRRAVNQLEDGEPADAKLKIVRRQMAAAWRGAKYIIRTTPPPPPAEDRALASGDGPTGPTKAAPADTAFLVITLQHNVAAGMIQSADGTPDSALPALSTTLNFALSQRDQAIRDIVAYAPPAPPDEDRAAPTAQASGGGPVVSTFETIMPNAIDQLDDELQAIDGLKSDSTDLTSGGRRLLTAATTHIARTRGVVNRTWPPIPPED